MPVGRCLVLLLLVACGDGGKDTSDTDTDTVDIPDDTFEGGDSDTTEPTFDSDDTGRFYGLVYEGHGKVARNASFEATQVLSARWLKHGTEPGAPRCMYVQALVDWQHDLSRSTHDPLTDDDTDTRDTLDRCPGCEFAFTVSLEEPHYAASIPATYTGFEDDEDFVPEHPWSDTDPDTDLVEPDPSSPRKLSCETLTTTLGFPKPEDILDQIGDWRGIGFDVEGDHDGDPQTGVIWTVGADDQWIQSYDGWWNSATGELFWTGVQPQEYPLY